jgi:hypothetical protein
MDNKFFKIILCFLISLALSSCSKYWYKPMGWVFNHVPKEGSPGFKLGWLHGCESGLGTQFGGAIYQSFYTWKRDPEIASANPDYNLIRKRYQKELKKVNWRDIQDIKKNFSDYNTIFWGAHSFCRQVIIGTLQTADMAPPVADEERFNPMAHSLGNIFKMTGKGDTRIGTGLW